MNRTNYLLFDLDGTLLNSREPIVDAVYATVQHYMPSMFTRNDLLERFGESFDTFLKKLEPELKSKATKEQVNRTYHSYMNFYHDEKLKFFPYVCEGLEYLKGSGCRLGIVTNKERELAIKGLEQGNIIQLFDTIVTLDDVTMGKPSAEPIIKAMASLRARPEQTFMVGDSRYDVLAAQAAQVRSVILDWNTQGNWEEPFPDYRFPDFRQFVENMYSLQRYLG